MLYTIYRTMLNSVGPIRVLVVVVALLALITVANPAAAQPGAELAVQTTSQADPAGIGIQDCSWWEPWC